MMIALKPDRIMICTGGGWHEVERALLGLDSGRLSSDGSYHAIIHPACLPAVG
jgi:stage II sporulation protein GA (sporulation sigma-E factor processing peptidase)